LTHKWVAKRPILNASQLRDVVKEKHKEVRRLRRNDTTKQMENSVKLRKKRIICKSPTTENSKKFQGCKCAVCNGLEVPVVENLVPTLLTFFAQKLLLHEAYDAAVNVFRAAFKGNSQTSSTPGNPWDIRTLVKVSNGESEQQFVVVL